ncbi:hypothetical protein EIK77_008793 [Talaromyces pinophilus]|nr:hypothetical protein EIK77_008793 [Talaromyces pinophilus]
MGYFTAQDGAYAIKRDILQHQTGFFTTPNGLLPRLNGNITNIERERTLTPSGNEHYRCELMPAWLGVTMVDPFSVSVFLFRIIVWWNGIRWIDIDSVLVFLCVVFCLAARCSHLGCSSAFNLNRQISSLINSDPSDTTSIQTSLR